MVGQRGQAAAVLQGNDILCEIDEVAPVVADEVAAATG